MIPFYNITANYPKVSDFEIFDLGLSFPIEHVIQHFLKSEKEYCLILRNPSNDPIHLGMFLNGEIMKSIISDVQKIKTDIVLLGYTGYKSCEYEVKIPGIKYNSFKKIKDDDPNTNFLILLGRNYALENKKIDWSCSIMIEHSFITKKLRCLL